MVYHILPPHAACGKVLVMHPEDLDFDFFPIREIVRPSDRQMSLDLVEPDGTLATVSFESHDGQNFVGTYRKKDQASDGVVRVAKRPREDGSIILNGSWKKASGEEWYWIGRIEPDEEHPEPAD